MGGTGKGKGKHDAWQSVRDKILDRSVCFCSSYFTAHMSPSRLMLEIILFLPLYLPPDEIC